MREHLAGQCRRRCRTPYLACRSSGPFPDAHCQCRRINLCEGGGRHRCRFIEENEDELWEWLLAADPDGTIQDEFCMTYMDECDGAIFDETKKPSKLCVATKYMFVKLCGSTAI